MKELLLPARTFNSLLLAILVAGVTGFTNLIFVISVAVLIFGNSFLFQYFVLHWALKQDPGNVSRSKFLFYWTLTAIIAILSSILLLSSINWNGSLEQIKTMFYIGSAAYIATSAAFVGGLATYLAFKRHGSLAK